MFIVYVLKSQKNGKRYVGFTSKEIAIRLNWHRWGLTAWTKGNRPFDLVHQELHNNKKSTLKREKYFKTGQGRKTLDSLIRAIIPLLMLRDYAGSS